MEEENNQSKKLVIKILKYANYSLLLFSLVFVGVNYKKIWGGAIAPKPITLPDCDKYEYSPNGPHFKCLLQRAELGDVESQYRVGYLYEDARFGDFNKAFEWYTKAAEQGNIDAQVALAKIYARGWEGNEESKVVGVKPNGEYQYISARANVIDRNYEKAVEWFTKAAEQGDTRAYIALGAMYAEGLGAPKDQKKADEFYRKAKESVAQEAKPITLPDCHKYEYSLDFYGPHFMCLLKRAELGDIESQYWVGHQYEDAPFGDYGKALEWYTNAAELGNIRAQVALATMYAEGRPKPDHGVLCGYARSRLPRGRVPQDYTKAIKWFTKAAEQGDTSFYRSSIDAYIALGAMHAEGLGVPKDQKKADEFYRKAEESVGDIKETLARMYVDGSIVPRNSDKAIELFLQVAEQDPKKAEYIYMELANLSNGFRLPFDYQKRLEWYTKAAELGNAHAQYWTAYMYFKGEGTEVNYKEASKWFHEAAKQGNKYAIQYLNEYPDKLGKQ